MELTIAMNAAEIDEAITEFIVKQGLVVASTPMDVSISGPRGAAGASAMIVVKSAIEEEPRYLESELKSLPPVAKVEKPATKKAEKAATKSALAKAAASVPPEPEVKEVPEANVETLFEDGAPEGELELPADVTEEVEITPEASENAEKVESLFG